MLYELGDYQIELPTRPPDTYDDSRWILWFGDKVLLNDNQVYWLAPPAEITEQEFIGLFNGKPYFTAQVSSNPTNVELSGLRDIAYLSETAFMLCARARGLLDWRSQHRFCGQCGRPTTETEEFATSCEPCRLRFYPRISPCIIVLVTRGDEVLLAQGERQKHQGWYSTIAGFIETGESAEQTVIREVKEEVNVDVTNIRYLNSQSWPFPNQLMLGFHADYVSGEIKPAAGEIADAKWFNIKKLPKHPPKISIAGWLIQQYLAERSKC